MARSSSRSGCSLNAGASYESWPSPILVSPGHEKYYLWYISSWMPGIFDAIPTAALDFGLLAGRRSRWTHWPAPHHWWALRLRPWSWVPSVQTSVRPREVQSLLEVGFSVKTKSGQLSTGSSLYFDKCGISELEGVFSAGTYKDAACSSPRITSKQKLWGSEKSWYNPATRWHEKLHLEGSLSAQEWVGSDFFALHDRFGAECRGTGTSRTGWLQFVAQFN